MTLNYAVFALILVGCGDNIQPELTWGDAEMVWSQAWCDYAKRCQPDVYTDFFENDQACLDYVYGSNCDTIDCAAKYDGYRHDALDQCESDFGKWTCGEIVAPTSCYTAFSNPPRF